MLEIPIQPQSPRPQRVIGGDDANELIGEERFGLQPRRGPGGIEHEVEPARRDIVEAPIVRRHDLQT